MAFAANTALLGIAVSAAQNVRQFGSFEIDG
jgi:hypothetical protein